MKKKITSNFCLKIFSFVCLVILSSLILSLISIGGYLTLVHKLRLVEEKISIAGTGSMYPTFPKGQSKTPVQQAREIVSTPYILPYPNGLVLFGRRLLGHEIEHGDIVLFTNDTVKNVTRELTGEPAGMVKRVIALPGDTIQLRDGLVYINNHVLSEPYIARARSTFGGQFLSDCKSLKIPPGKLFVMGDNRKGSDDSRYDVGFISYGDVTHVLPLNNQRKTLALHWRETANDTKESAKIQFDQKNYLALLNQKREESGLKPLTYQTKLEQSAQLRGQAMLKYDDFSFGATKSGYPMQKALKDSGYSNITWGEASIVGYYDADELIDNIFEFPQWKKFLLDKDFQDFGVAQVEGNLEDCPSQVVVQHLGGYVPPNYSKDIVQSWEDALNSLQKIRPGWQQLKDKPEFYNEHKSDVDRINQIIDIRTQSIDEIVQKMERNLWLTQEQAAYAKKDEELAKEQQDIATRLNNQ